MSIASEITRIQGAKANLKTAIEGKGVTVPSSTKLDGYADLVDDIQTGGEPNLQDKTVSYTPTESQQTAMVTADSGYDGLDEVSITVGAIDSEYVGSDVPRKSSADLTVSGATVNVPSGYYSASASKSVKNGTEGTPTATKGAVSNHAIDVTPSVTNTEGYIAGGTKSGTAVNVFASELVSGTKSITQNGTEDVTNYELVDVNVPNSYSASDEGKVVDNGALVAQTSATYTENGTYDTTLIDDVTVNVSGGGEFDFDKVAQHYTGSDDTLTLTVASIPAYAFRGWGFTAIDAPNVKSIGQQALASNKFTTVFFPSLTTVGQDVFIDISTMRTMVFAGGIKDLAYGSFRNMTGLLALDIGDGTTSSIKSNAIVNCTSLNTLIIRKPTVMALAAVNSMNATAFASSRSGGTLYVPQSLISSYEAATNWSTILGYANNKILPIEGSIYETQYADGTPIS